MRDDDTPGTATLSLVDLRRQLIRKAATAEERAKRARQAGDNVGAQRLLEQAMSMRAAAAGVRTRATREVEDEAGSS